MHPRYPIPNNQLRLRQPSSTSYHLGWKRNCATVQGDKTTYAAGTTKNIPTLWSMNGSDALIEVHNPNNLTYDLINQSEQIMTSSKQSNDVNQTETEITSVAISFQILSLLSEHNRKTVQNF
ncbi:hypothetical protein Tco_1360828 [Tanacetum coccineum]